MIQSLEEPSSFDIPLGTMPKIEFWFDFGSPYSYLTASRIEKVCQERKIEICWRPFLLGPIFKDQGWDTSPFVVYPAEGQYLWKEMDRFAKIDHLPYQKPDLFPQNGLLASRIVLAADGETWIPRLILKVFQAEFEKKLNIAEPSVIREILLSERLNPAVWIEKAGSEKNKQKLRQRTDEARARGIFGAPSFLVGDELFWGDDRLEQACQMALGQPFFR